MSSLGSRMILAAKLDVDLYEEVEVDPSATGQAMLIVLLSGVAAGIGSSDVAGMKGFLFGMLSALAGWYIWALVTYFIVTKLMPDSHTEEDVGQWLRTVGFSSSPGLLRVCGIIPGLRDIVFLGCAIWMLAAMVIAVRRVLEYHATVRAIAACLIGWVVNAVFIFLVLKYLGIGPVPQT